MEVSGVDRYVRVFRELEQTKIRDKKNCGLI